MAKVLQDTDSLVIYVFFFYTEKTQKMPEFQFMSKSGFDYL